MTNIIDIHFTIVLVATATVVATVTVVSELAKERKQRGWEQSWLQADDATREHMLNTVPSEKGFAGLIERWFFRKELAEVRTNWNKQVEATRLRVKVQNVDYALSREACESRGIPVTGYETTEILQNMLAKQDTEDGVILAERTFLKKVQPQAA